MDVLITAIAGVVGSVAAFVTAIAVMKGKSVDASTVLFNSMNGHMTTLSTENTDLRGRVRTLETRTNEQDKLIAEARTETAQCEADKNVLKDAVEELRRELDEYRRQR